MKKKILLFVMSCALALGAVGLVASCGEENDNTTDNNPEEPVHVHTYEQTASEEATCTKAGSVTKTCSGCGDVQTETVKALGHDYTSAKSEDGTKIIYTCSRCGDTYEEAVKDNTPSGDHLEFTANDAVLCYYSNGAVIVNVGDDTATLSDPVSVANNDTDGAWWNGGTESLPISGDFVVQYTWTNTRDTSYTDAVVEITDGTLYWDQTTFADLWGDLYTGATTTSAAYYLNGAETTSVALGTEGYFGGDYTVTIVRNGDELIVLESVVKTDGNVYGYVITQSGFTTADVSTCLTGNPYWIDDIKVAFYTPNDMSKITVNFVDENGNKLADSVTKYAAEGGTVTLTPPYVNGYMPENEIYKISNVSAGAEYNVVYSVMADNTALSVNQNYISGSVALTLPEEITMETGVTFTFLLSNCTSDWTYLLSSTYYNITYGNLSSAETNGHTIYPSISAFGGDHWNSLIGTDERFVAVTILDGRISFYVDGEKVISYGAGDLMADANDPETAYDYYCDTWAHNLLKCMIENGYTLNADVYTMHRFTVSTAKSDNSIKRLYNAIYEADHSELVVKYICESDNNRLLGEYRWSGLATDYSLTPPDILGYRAVSNETITGRAEGGRTTIIFYYRQCGVSDVVVNYVDESGNAILDPESYQVTAPSYYLSAPELEDYICLSDDYFNGGMVAGETYEITFVYKLDTADHTYVDFVANDAVVQYCTKCGKTRTAFNGTVMVLGATSSVKNNDTLGTWWDGATDSISVAGDFIIKWSWSNTRDKNYTDAVVELTDGTKYWDTTSLEGGGWGDLFTATTKTTETWYLNGKVVSKSLTIGTDDFTGDYVATVVRNGDMLVVVINLTRTNKDVYSWICVQEGFTTDALTACINGNPYWIDDVKVTYRSGTVCETHDWSNKDGVCVVCGTKCAHPSFTDSVCDTCGYTCTSHTYDTSVASPTGLCTICGTACAHSEGFTSGACNTCGYICPHTDIDSTTRICALCGAQICTDHDWSNKDGVCKVCSTKCEHDWSKKDGTCTICGYACSHDAQENGACTTCGAEFVPGLWTAEAGYTSANITIADGKKVTLTSTFTDGGTGTWSGYLMHLTMTAGVYHFRMSGDYANDGWTYWTPYTGHTVTAPGWIGDEGTDAFNNFVALKKTAKTVITATYDGGTFTLVIEYYSDGASDTTVDTTQTFTVSGLTDDSVTFGLSLDGATISGGLATKSLITLCTEHDWSKKDGICTICGTACSHTTWNDTTCTTCGYVHTHTYDKTAATGACTVANCTNTCSHATFTSAVSEGVLTSTCDTCGYSCPHTTWSSGVCSVCKYDCTAGHVWDTSAETMKATTGACTICGTTHTHEWESSYKCETCLADHGHVNNGKNICTICGKSLCTTHTWVYTTTPGVGTCSVCGETCSTHDWSNKDGKCANCNYECDHSGNIGVTNALNTCDTCGETVETIYYNSGTVSNVKLGAISGAANGLTISFTLKSTSDTSDWGKVVTTANDYRICLGNLDPYAATAGSCKGYNMYCWQSSYGGDYSIWAKTVVTSDVSVVINITAQGISVFKAGTLVYFYGANDYLGAASTNPTVATFVKEFLAEAASTGLVLVPTDTNLTTTISDLSVTELGTCSTHTYMKGYTACVVCGKVACTHSNYTNGVCSTCGYICPHTSIVSGECEACELKVTVGTANNSFESNIGSDYGGTGATAVTLVAGSAETVTSTFANAGAGTYFGLVVRVTTTSGTYIFRMSGDFYASDWGKAFDGHTATVPGWIGDAGTNAFMTFDDLKLTAKTVVKVIYVNNTLTLAINYYKDGANDTEVDYTQVYTITGVTDNSVDVVITKDGATINDGVVEVVETYS